MVRGTTPTFDFELENLDMIHDIEITFSQNQNSGVFAVQKELKKGEIEEHEGFVRCTLSQEDTFAFSVGNARIQMRVISSNGNVAASDIVRIKVEESLSEDRLTTTGGN